MSITFYDDIQFIGADEAPDCRARIDQEFGSTLAMNLLWRGRIWFEVDGGERFEIEGPAAYWTWGGPRFRYARVPGQGWHQLWVLAGGPRTAAMVSAGLVPIHRRPCARPADPEGFLARMRRLIGLVRHGRSSDQAERAQVFESLFREAVVARQTEEYGRAPETLIEQVEKLALAIAEQPTRKWDFEREARRLGVSYHHLRRRFTAKVGRAPQAYVLDCRVRWAAARLATGSSSVKAVAYDAGFKDPRSFARQFKRRSGIAPGAMLGRRSG